MSFTDPSHLVDVLNSLTTELSGALTTAGVPVDREVISPGPPAFDCPGLYVHGRTKLAALGTTQDPNRMYAQVKVVLDVTVWLLRCATAVGDPATGLPSAADVHADGETVHTDMWVLQRAITLGARAGTLGGLGSCASTKLNPISPVQAQGGFIGVTTLLELTLG